MITFWGGTVQSFPKFWMTQKDVNDYFGGRFYIHFLHDGGTLKIQTHPLGCRYPSTMKDIPYESSLSSVTDMAVAFQYESIHFFLEI